jgi:hypothetical protein
MGYWWFTTSLDEVVAYLNEKLEEAYEDGSLDASWWIYRFKELLKLVERFRKENEIWRLPVVGFIVQEMPEYNNIFIKVLMAADRFRVDEDRDEPRLEIVDLEEMFDP